MWVGGLILPFGIDVADVGPILTKKSLNILQMIFLSEVIRLSPILHLL